MSYYFQINFHSKEKEQLVLKTFLFGCNKRFREPFLTNYTK